VLFMLFNTPHVT